MFYLLPEHFFGVPSVACINIVFTQVHVYLEIALADFTLDINAEGKARATG